MNRLLCNECTAKTLCEFNFCKAMKFGTETWETRGFKSRNLITVFENKNTGNIVAAKYSEGEYLTPDEIEIELF